MTTDHTQTILVAYATKHGSTKEVAEAIATQLERHGHTVDLLPAADVRELTGYMGVVLGGSLYTGRWHGDCRRFLRRYKNELGKVPVAVFAMGPRTLADEDVAGARKQLDAALAEVPEVQARLVAIFGGVVYPTKLRFPFSRMSASDARDWEVINRWADEASTLITAEHRLAKESRGVR